MLFPAWILCEWTYSARNHIGADVYIGRFLVAWAILYLTVFLDSERRIVRGILFAVAAIAIVTGILLLLESWRSWFGMNTYLLFHTRVWGWIDIAVLPLFFSLFRLRKSFIPVLASIAFGIALPWCTRSWTEYYTYGTNHGSWTRTEPDLAAHALVAAFCVFVIWWGVRETSRALVNLGVVGFGVTVAWFYFSNIFDKVGRSLGLIGLGVLFLAGGWVLEKTRRGLLAHMAQPTPSALEAQ